jgi:hypothetical protein
MCQDLDIISLVLVLLLHELLPQQVASISHSSIINA